MASIGLRKPYFAIYNNNNGVVTYSKGGILGGAIEFSANIESGKDNNLYADDGITETDRTFSGGTVSITTDDLSEDASCAVLGIIKKEITIGDPGIKANEIVYDESVAAPYLGFGIIIPKMKNGIIFYRALIFSKIMFNIPEESAATKGESIEWKTPKIDGTVLRSDAVGRAWKREVTVESEEIATTYIKQCLNIKDTPIV